jgi:hypothetical protein
VGWSGGDERTSAAARAKGYRRRSPAPEPGCTGRERLRRCPNPAQS